MKNFFFILLFLGNIVNCIAKDYVITNYGISSDSTYVNTGIIQSVIDKAAAEGGGTIVIPKGTYLTGALFFKPNTRLRLEEGAVLKGSDRIDDYPLLPSRMEGKNIYYYAALINAYHVDNFEIIGPGMVNGNGHKFWATFWAHRAAMKKAGKVCTNLEVHRPRLVFVWGCDNIKLSGVKLHNAGYWTTHFYQCNNILIENCEMRTPPRPLRAPSTDAVDLDVCKKVVIRNCYMSTDDDGVCIKGGKGPFAHQSAENGIVEDVLVENCTFGPNLHGTLTMGSEAIHARNITMRNCKVENSCALLRLKMRPDTYQIYENITIENITGQCGDIIGMAPWTQFYNLEGSGEKPKGIIRNIRIENLKVKCKSLGRVSGNPEDSAENVVLRNIDAVAEREGFTNKYNNNVKLENVKVNGHLVESK